MSVKDDREHKSALVPQQDDKAILAAQAEIEAMFGEAGGEGLEHVRSEDLVLPRLAILQPVSPLAQEEGYRPGDMVNTITGDNFGKTLDFYPLQYWETRIHWVDPTVQGGAIDCQSRDGIVGTKRDAPHAGGNCAKCPFAQWSDDGQGPRCTSFKNLMIIPSGQDASPMVFSGKRTAERPVRQMVSAALMLRRNGKNPPFYSSLWTITVEKQQNDQGVFFTPKFTRKEYVSDPALFVQLRELYGSMKQAQDRIVIAPETEETAPAAEYESTGDF
jgi:hypothetical protein